MKLRLRPSLALAAVLALSGCAGQPVITQVHLDCGPDPTTDAVSLLPVKPFVVVEGAAASICMSPDDYENLSENMALIKAHIQQKNTIIRYYRDCVTAPRP